MTGSIVNRTMEASRYPEITVGMGVTFCYWSDRSPGTVVAVRYAADGTTVKEIDIRGDHVSRNLDVWPAQRYEITPAPEVPDTVTPVQTWRMDRAGRLRKTYLNENGSRVFVSKTGGPGIVLGSRDYYQDPSF
jgi:hypothetical protein